MFESLLMHRFLDRIRVQEKKNLSLIRQIQLKFESAGMDFGLLGAKKKRGQR